MASIRRSVSGRRVADFYELWGQNKMAIVVNVGTLVRPTTKQQMYDVTHPKPYNMFSHSDQATQHQSGRSDRTASAGWGGLLSDQRNAVDNPGALGPHDHRRWQAHSFSRQALRRFRLRSRRLK
jgi:hypothetical protein